MNETTEKQIDKLNFKIIDLYNQIAKVGEEVLKLKSEPSPNPETMQLDFVTRFSDMYSVWFSETSCFRFQPSWYGIARKSDLKDRGEKATFVKSTFEKLKVNDAWFYYDTDDVKPQHINYAVSLENGGIVSQYLTNRNRLNSCWAMNNKSDVWILRRGDE